MSAHPELKLTHSVSPTLLQHADARHTLSPHHFKNQQEPEIALRAPGTEGGCGGGRPSTDIKIYLLHTHLLLPLHLKSLFCDVTVSCHSDQLSVTSGGLGLGWGRHTFMMHKGPGGVPWQITLPSLPPPRGDTVEHKRGEKRKGKAGSSWREDIRSGQNYKYRRIVKAQSTGKLQKHGWGMAGNMLGKTGRRVSSLKGPEC